MKLKHSVSLKGLGPEILPAWFVTNQFFEGIKKEFTITSVSDGNHKPNSLHYSGKAFDFRTEHLNDTEIQACLNYLRFRLDKQYDVVLEVDHIHVEWDEHA